MVLVLSVPLGWFAARVQRVRKQQEVAEAIRQIGGTVFCEWEPLNGPERRAMGLHDLRTPRWIRKCLGEEFSDVVAVRLMGFQVSESDFALLEGLPNLRALDLIDSPVSDADLEHLKGLESLRVLVLRNTEVTPEGIASLHEALPKCLILLNPDMAPYHYR